MAFILIVVFSFFLHFLVYFFSQQSSSFVRYTARPTSNTTIALLDGRVVIDARMVSDDQASTASLDSADINKNCFRVCIVYQLFLHCLIPVFTVVSKFERGPLHVVTVRT